MPFQYWETYDASHGGVIEDINEKGLLIQSFVDMVMGEELRINIFFSVENKFIRFQPLIKIIGKDLCHAEGSEAYKYNLKFLGISQYDRLKLRYILSIRRPGKSVLDRPCPEKSPII